MNTQIAKQRYGKIVESLSTQSTIKFSADKKSWLAEYAYCDEVARLRMGSTSINENMAYMTNGNLDGMGAISPAIPSLTPGLVGTDYSTVGAAGGIGSGDVAQHLLATSMYIAANTFALDILAVKPSPSPSVILTFIDIKYNDNTEDALNPKEEKPFIFYLKNNSDTNPLYNDLVTGLKTQLSVMGIHERRGFLDGRMFVKLSGASYGTVSVGQINTQSITPTTNKLGMLEFLGFRAYGNGEPMFRAFNQNNTPSSAGNYGFQATQNTFPQSITTVATELSNNAIVTWGGGSVLSGYTVSGLSIDMVSYGIDNLPSATSNWNTDSMTRDEAERTYPNVIGAKTFTKSFQIGEIHLKAALTLREIEDTKASTGIDLVQKMQQTLVNALSQKISIDITRKIEQMGELNRTLNHVPKDNNGNSKYDFDIDTYLGISGNAPQGESNPTICRQLVKKIGQASAFISTTGRVGEATYLKTNSLLAGAIKEGSNYQLVKDDLSDIKMNRQMYPYAQIGRMTVYVDPNQSETDMRIFLGRKNNVDEPGLIFCPYLMAQEIRLIPEATMGQVLYIRSRYAIVDYGFLPHLQFLAMHITDTHGVL